MQRHTTLAGEARTASACRYKWSGHGEIAVSVLGYEPPDLNSHSSRPWKTVHGEGVRSEEMSAVGRNRVVADRAFILI